MLWSKFFLIPTSPPIPSYPHLSLFLSGLFKGKGMWG